MGVHCTKLRLVKLILIAIAVVFAIVLPSANTAILLAQGEGPFLPPDSDLDGLSDAVEIQGWVNERANDQGGGVPYRTDPYDTDSDDDGLADGEEMLFNTNPLDRKSPGLYTIYEDSFQTGEYIFAWTPIKRSGIFRPQGHKMIGTETLVIRRGTTFTVGGPGVVDGYPVSLTWGDALKNPGVLTPLTIGPRNACTDRCNSWTVSVPSNGTVGKYKLVASNGHGWTDTLIVDVIFEMPSGLTDAQVDGFLYDGDRNNTKDKTGIWFYGTGADPDQDLKIRLYGYKYDLDQFSAYIFDGSEAIKRYYGGPASKYPSVIKAVHGKTSTWDASASLTKLADDFTCFAYPLTVRTTAWSTLFPGGSNLNNQCSNIAGLLTSFHRSVGIPARMVAVDHRNSNFDTSTEIWTRSNSSSAYTWYTARAFATTEGDPDNNGYCSLTHVSGGYRVRVSRSQYGSQYYRPYSRVWPTRGSASNGNEWMMITANEKWNENETNGWPPDYKWVVWDKYKVARNDWFETLAMPYWNRDYRVDQEPTNVGDPDTTNPPAWNSPIPSSWLADTPPGTPTLNSISNPERDGNYIVHWNSVSGAQAYRLEEDSNSNFTSPTTRYNGQAKDKSISGQPAGTWYYRVRAENSAGASAWSNVQSVTVGGAGLSVLAVSPDSSENALPADSTTALDFDKVRLGDIVTEHGLDEDRDGKFDSLELQVVVEVKQPGSYWIQAQLGTDDPSFWGTGGVMAVDQFKVDLEQGEQIVHLVFDGLSISRTRVNGPYKLMYLLITDVDNPAPDDFVNGALDSKNNSYVTAAYRFNEFKTLDAMFARSYSDRALDSDKDGHAEALEIDVSLDIYRPGNYTVTGELYDDNNISLGEATWSGTTDKATLRFNNIGGTSGPYILRNLLLSRAEGEGLDEIEQAYTAQNVSAGEPVSGFTTIPVQDSGGIGPLGVGITTTTYLEVPVDQDNNGKYDSLQIKVGMQVVNPDEYQLEGWLVDEQGNLVSWAHTGPVVLEAGNHELSLTYEGRTLSDYMKTHAQASQKFTLVALKLYTGPLKWDEINDEVDTAYTTNTYSFGQFEPGVKGAALLLDDFVENGAGQWTAESPWEIAENRAYFSPDHAWRAGDANASLQTVFSLTKIAKPVLKFRTYYKLYNTNEFGYVKASSNGNNWETIATFSNKIESWQTQVLDLSLFGSEPTVYLRFELNSAGGSSDDFWYIDDVIVAGQLNDPDNDGLSNDQEIAIGTDPHNPDTDNDGMPDGWEVDHGLDPKINDANGDADSDGLTNLEEYQHGTDPHKSDTDGDGLPDGWEVRQGLDPTDSTGNNGASGDPDGDQLTNEEEYQKGTHPNNPDTDGDGIPDNQDPRTEFRFFLPTLFK